jgi:hypothetical protein
MKVYIIVDAYYYSTYIVKVFNSKENALAYCNSHYSKVVRPDECWKNGYHDVYLEEYEVEE